MRKNTWIALLCLCLLWLVGGGCELEGEDNDVEQTGPADTYSAPDAVADTNVVYLSYRYARIDDLSDDEREGTPGAEIDAVELRGANGSPKGYAVNVFDYVPVNEDINEHMDPTEALGPPNPECRDDQGFVALGGIGGHLIIDFGEHIIEEGDVIVVYEVGGCRVDDGPVLIEDPFGVWISPDANNDTLWVTLGAFDGGVSSVQIGSLPQVPAEP